MMRYFFREFLPADFYILSIKKIVTRCDADGDAFVIVASWLKFTVKVFTFK